ncbi:uncharacterized protein I206_106118 [Kwoniella pini CBS 10737]|uniref:General stress protein FMN-binding split barrel domain-containing protein n=1 Tax=Kwoniella pini CBS 10737 TaxID=1296096 RepID=A0A1B9I158_9TREE|nr:uncharacterized protein I206_04942 [Kwoniella pini CBS 10737]OCF49254.1 hypothetical protein I206_04942 [Kwoniella pini CBS 10737]
MSDQYSASASTSPSLTEKLTTLRAFFKAQKAVILTTRAEDGSLHARVMAVAEITPDWKFRFIYDKESHKDNEVENDSHVNIAVDGTQNNTGWASIAGKAKRVEDNAVVEKLWNPTIKAWFSDKGDGVHDGTPSDPRVVVFEVKVDEIRHFHQEKTGLGTLVDVVSSTISGSTATPGSIRTITGEEIAGAWAKNELKEP